jgi:hypothetical protein
MQTVSDFLTAIPGVPIEHMLALIALAGLGLAIFAIYVVFSLVRERQGR